MTTVAKKLLLGTAAFAVAGALMAPVVAVADTEDTGTDTASVGTSAGNTPKRAPRGAVARSGANASAPSNNTPSAPPADAPDAPAAPDAVEIPTVGADASADALGSNPLIQNPLIWIGTPNPVPPPTDVIYDFQPLADMPGYQRSQFGWMRDFEFEACVLGLSSVTRGQNVVGPYGTFTTGFSSSGCA